MSLRIFRVIVIQYFGACSNIQRNTRAIASKTISWDVLLPNLMVLEKDPHPALSHRERGKSSWQKVLIIGVRESCLVYAQPHLKISESKNRFTSVFTSNFDAIVLAGMHTRRKCAKIAPGQWTRKATTAAVGLKCAIIQRSLAGFAAGNRAFILRAILSLASVKVCLKPNLLRKNRLNPGSPRPTGCDDSLPTLVPA